MYELTQEDIDTYWMAIEGGMGWMRKWLGWWVCPNYEHSTLIREWCNDVVGEFDIEWAYYDGRYYFKDKNIALMFLLKFGTKDRRIDYEGW